MKLIIKSTNLLLRLVELLPLCSQKLANFTCPTRQRRVHDAHNEPADSPNPASGFSALILSRQSWLKNMYAESARFGAFGSFLPLAGREVLSAAALLRDYITNALCQHQVHVQTQVEKKERSATDVLIIVDSSPSLRLLPWASRTGKGKEACCQPR